MGKNRKEIRVKGEKGALTLIRKAKSIGKRMEWSS